MKAALCIVLAATLAVSAPTSTFAANAACSRFKPGHYFTVADDSTLKVDGLGVLRNKLALDVRNFKGVVYMMPWGMLEKSKGVYDFSRLDAALAQVRAKNKYLVLRFMDRTFWTGCSSNFVPSYVPREKSANTYEPNTCYSKIWETTTADNMIRVLQQVASRYKNDPNFLGITMEETSISPNVLRSEPRLGVYTV